RAPCGCRLHHLRLTRHQPTQADSDPRRPPRRNPRRRRPHQRTFHLMLVAADVTRLTYRLFHFVPNFVPNFVANFVGSLCRMFSRLCRIFLPFAPIRLTRGQPIYFLVLFSFLLALNSRSADEKKPEKKKEPSQVIV